MDQNTKQYIKDYFKTEWLFSHGEILLLNPILELENFRRMGGKILNKITQYTIKLNNEIVAHAYKKYNSTGREIEPELEFLK